MSSIVANSGRDHHLFKDHLFVPAYRGDIAAAASKMLPEKTAHTMRYRPRARLQIERSAPRGFYRSLAVLN